MSPSFDVFQIDDQDRVVWRGSAESLPAAKATIQKLMQASPSDYLILDESNGQRLIVMRDADKTRVQ
ncbi:MAG: hypothetical protein ACHP8A_18960 [Terriglobales bacterium]